MADINPEGLDAVQNHNVADLYREFLCEFVANFSILTSLFTFILLLYSQPQIYIVFVHSFLFGDIFNYGTNTAWRAVQLLKFKKQPNILFHS